VADDRDGGRHRQPEVGPSPQQQTQTLTLARTQTPIQTLRLPRWDDMREHGTFSRSNKTSVPYNPISLEYDAGGDGDRLRFRLAAARP
jgi:hypothetical protein